MFLQNIEWKWKKPLKKIISCILVILSVLLILSNVGRCESMIDLYTALIIAKKRTIETIPARYKIPVTEQLASVGLDENGDVIK